MKISEHIHALKIPFKIPVAPEKTFDRFVYSYLVYGDEICLIDSGVASSERVIFDYIKKSEREPGEISLLILTHAHPDHIGSAKAIKKTTGCDVAAKVDILVNNAGYAVTKMAMDTTEKDWDKMLDTGLKGVFFCSQIIGSIMFRQNYGKIINLGSTFSHSTIPGRSVYAALKAGLVHLTKSLAVEWAQSGIRVNVSAPTAVKTHSRESLLQGDTLKMVLSRIPLGRLATQEDLICATIYLSSAASDFITGQTLFVDGGWVAKG